MGGRAFNPLGRDDMKPGDVVRIRQDCMAMTINQIADDGLCECLWFDPYGSLHKEYLHQSTLIKE